MAAVTAAGLADTLSGGLLTVLAPTDEAFKKLPEGTVEGFMSIHIDNLSTFVTSKFMAFIYSKYIHTYTLYDLHSRPSSTNPLV